MFVGIAASRLRDMFSHCSSHQVHCKKQGWCSQSFFEMDGSVANEAVVVLAATNRPDVLDSKTWQI